MVFIREGEFHIGTLVRRENRFVVFVESDDQVLRCHLPNPGRMVELLFEGETQLIYTKAPVGSARKTDGSVIGIIYPDDTVINLDTMMFNPLLTTEINVGTNILFRNWKIIDQEHNIGSHRFDFILDIDGKEIITEVKSTTRVIDGTACFPDAVSKRATDHLRALEKLVDEGRQCMIIFTVYKSAENFQPCAEIDPVFAATFYELQDKIKVMVLQIQGQWIDHNHISYEISGEITVNQ